MPFCDHRIVEYAYNMPWAFKALDNYHAQRKEGKDPVFVAEDIAGLPATECWHIEKDDLPHVGPQPVKEYFEEAIDADGEAVGLK